MSIALQIGQCGNQIGLGMYARTVLHVCTFHIIPLSCICSILGHTMSRDEERREESSMRLPRMGLLCGGRVKEQEVSALLLHYALDTDA